MNPDAFLLSNDDSVSSTMHMFHKWPAVYRKKYDESNGVVFIVVQCCDGVWEQSRSRSVHSKRDQCENHLLSPEDFQAGIKSLLFILQVRNKLDRTMLPFLD